ncbi:MAG TPA: multicopper oxidase domain-containing protein [Anaerolineales bacterium]|nr:multicopper oxidase domain-containing protein [Anaerolineales bacterium]
MISRKGFLKLAAAGGASAYLATRGGFVRIGRAAQSQQTPLNPKLIPQFVDPLPDLLDGDHLIVAGATQIELQMRRQVAYVLSTGSIPNYAGTKVWSYLKPGQASRISYLGPVIVATRNQPTEIKFINELGYTDAAPDAYKYSTDQTLHWADPLNDGMNMWNHMAMPPLHTQEGARNYGEGPLGFGPAPIPAVPHLHGGYVPPQLDGGPDAWFTSDGSHIGAGYYSKDNLDPKNYCIYRYPNQQEPTLVWFHDHTLGATRLNVYMGLAGAYLITDPATDPPNLPPMIPLVIQDRMFDTAGEFFFPADSAGGVLWALNPEHPYWVPEFIGDTIVVNGKTWPFTNVDARRYTLLFINGSNARGYELSLIDPVSKNLGPALYVIGTDGGYLDAPVKIDPAARANNKLVMLPGERYWVIVDFAGFQAGVIGPNGAAYSGNWILKNTAKAPYPGGASPNGATTGRIMQFRVIGSPGTDSSYNPATGAPLRTPMVRLNQITPTKVRALTLNEIMGMPQTATDPVTDLPVAYPGGPLEILVNNTKWDGKRITGIDEVSGEYTMEAINPDWLKDPGGNYISEVPLEGTTEVWEIINTTADAHPIHTHLAQFQLLSRQAYNTSKYTKAYAAAFGGGFDFTMHMQMGAGVFIPAYGPPLDYDVPDVNGKFGGNPDITPYLQGPQMGPLPQENGWKDTVVAFPGQVTRFAVRWGPQGALATDPPEQSCLSFDPSGGGYVWHCHIVDHEDNEMMRPDAVEPNPLAPARTYIKGTDY